MDIACIQSPSSRRRYINLFDQVCRDKYCCQRTTSRLQAEGAKVGSPGVETATSSRDHLS